MPSLVIEAYLYRSFQGSRRRSRREHHSLETERCRYSGRAELIGLHELRVGSAEGAARGCCLAFLRDSGPRSSGLEGLELGPPAGGPGFENCEFENCELA